MKRIFGLGSVVAILMMLIVFQSCDEEKVEEIVDLGSMKAVIDGKMHDFPIVEAIEADEMLAVAGAVIQNDSLIFTLFMDDDIEDGTYTIEIDTVMPAARLKFDGILDDDFSAMLMMKGKSVYFPYSGTLKVEKHDKGAKTIKGTFSLTMINAEKEEIEVKDGAFNVEYKKFELPEE